MSGGLDSSLAAYLLKKEGFEVIGATLNLEPEREKDFKKRNPPIEAKKIAKKLNIPHYLFEVKDIFKKKVIDDFSKEYRRGRTPNPCIRCNRFIKFDYLLKKADNMGIDFLATGHYARIEYDKKRRKYLLKKGIDSKKDQSYFLYTLRQRELSRIFFPLGKYTKEEIKRKAGKLGLSSLAKRESQDICFIPEKNYRDFLERWVPEAVSPGKIFNAQGELLGKHSGIAFYTIGQRKGLGISYHEPLYVTSIDPKSHRIFLDREESLYRKELIAENINYIYLEKIPRNLEVKAKIRYLHPEAKAKLIPQKEGRILLSFQKAQRAITPGQAVVFYEGEKVLGGGIIRKAV